MEHLSFDVICRMADEDLNRNEKALAAAHLKTCRSCQREVEVQRLFMKTSRQSPLVKPSAQFTQNVLESIVPSQKKRWYQWMLQNMGNIIAMTMVLGFLGYIFSVTSTQALPGDKPAKIEPIIGFLKIIQDGSRQISEFVVSKFISHGDVTPSHHTLFFALLAMILLVFIDHIAGYFIQRSKV
ncbi:MAG: hypothetical protein EHM64_09920 [Ignavibacteriae bacterium]|nr:MAG: hypothetical protein EHM64_09920 [Ignavibacteriota bacterium]